MWELKYLVQSGCMHVWLSGHKAQSHFHDSFYPEIEGTNYLQRQADVKFGSGSCRMPAGPCSAHLGSAVSFDANGVSCFVGLKDTANTESLYLPICFRLGSNNEDLKVISCVTVYRITVMFVKLYNSMYYAIYNTNFII